VGSTPKFTPMMMNDCTPTTRRSLERPVPGTGAPAPRPAADGELPEHQPRKKRDHRDHPANPSSSPITASRSRCAPRGDRELLDACASPRRPLAAAEGDQGVRKLVARPTIRPRIHEAENSLHAIGRRQTRRRNHGHHHHNPANHVPFIPPRNRTPSLIARDHDKSAEVGFPKQEQPTPAAPNIGRRPP